MSFEDEIQTMRAREVEPAPFERLAQKQAEPQQPLGPLRTPSVATLGAALAFLVLFVRPAIGAGAFTSGGRLELHVAALLPLFVLGWAFRRFSQPSLGAQLLCRAVWWSSLVVGLLISLNYGETPDKVLGAVIAVASAVALLSVGERGLEVQDPDSPFAPVRFRGHLLLALVMAAADALTLAFSGLLQLRLGSRGWNLLSTLGHAGPTIVAAIVMGVAVWGVYRLRTWALLLNLIANIAIAYLALEGTLGLSPSVSVSLATTAAIQCFIPVPILAAALGDRNAGQPLLQSMRHRLMNYTVLVLATASVLATFMSGADGWVDGPGRAFIRGGVRNSKQTHRANADLGRVSRAELNAVSDDLRGRSFDGMSLRWTDFSGADLRGASFEQVRAHMTGFDHAQLQGASFRQADLSNASFRGAELEGTDFTGAFLSQHAATQPGTICPDGRLAYEDGSCAHKYGYSAEPLELRWVETGGLPGCPTPGTVTKTGVEGRYITVLGQPYVRLDDGDLRSMWGSIDVDGSRWELDSGPCGRNVLRVGPSARERLSEGPAGPLDFNAHDLSDVDFRGEALDAADFAGALLTNVRFDRASLRNANFRLAGLDVALEGADLRGADFTGASTTPWTWYGVEATSLLGATCPDAREPDPHTGCSERNAVMTLERAPEVVRWLESERCWDVGETQTWSADETHLYDASGEPLVPLHGGRFVSGQTMISIEPDGTYTVDSKACGRGRVEVLTTAPLGQ